MELSRFYCILSARKGSVGQLYFDTRCPFGLRTSAMISQRSTKAVIYIFTQSGFSADIYLDGFFDAKIPALADTALAAWQSLCRFSDRLNLFA